MVTKETQGGRTIAAATWIDIIVPRPANLAALLDNDKTPAFAAPDQIDGSA